LNEKLIDFRVFQEDGSLKLVGRLNMEMKKQVESSEKNQKLSSESRIEKQKQNKDLKEIFDYHDMQKANFGFKFQKKA
jgi:archaellum component FlaC